MDRRRLVIVGGGVLGTMHAVSGVRRGYEVVQLERDELPRGASVRNFGLVWVSGRKSGPELELALRAREQWEKVAEEFPGTGFRANGSFTIARRDDELDALELALETPSASERGFELLSAKELIAAEPALEAGALGMAGGPPILGALRCLRDATVEPRLVLGALRRGLVTSGRYRFYPGRLVVNVRPHGVLDAAGHWHEGDLVVCCVGTGAGALLSHHLASAPLRRVRLQMLETEPFRPWLSSALADADTLRYYPAYEGAPRERLAPQDDIGVAWAAQLLLVRRLGGHLTIGDTHRYDEPFSFDLHDEPYRHLLEIASGFLGPLPQVERRWAGVYSEVTDGSLYYRAEVEPGVFVVTGSGGRGMTMSPAIAEETFT